VKLNPLTPHPSRPPLLSPNPRSGKAIRSRISYVESSSSCRQNSEKVRTSSVENLLYVKEDLIIPHVRRPPPPPAPTPHAPPHAPAAPRTLPPSTPTFPPCLPPHPPSLYGQIMDKERGDLWLCFFVFVFAQLLCCWLLLAVLQQFTFYELIINKAKGTHRGCLFAFFFPHRLCRCLRLRCCCSNSHSMSSSSTKQGAESWDL